MLRTVLFVTAAAMSALPPLSAGAQAPPGSGGGASCACVCEAVGGDVNFNDYAPVNGSCTALLNRTCNVQNPVTQLIRSGRILFCDLEQASSAEGQRADTADPSPPGGGVVLPGGPVFNNQVLSTVPSTGTAPQGNIGQPFQVVPLPGVVAPRP